MKKVENILFVCKYNRFRSKVAEAYFKRIDKKIGVKVKSAGIIEVNKPLDVFERRRNVYLKKTFGFSLKAKSVSVSIKSLLWADKIIIVADDVPKVLFNSVKWKDKVEIWSVPDEGGNDEEKVNKIVKFIMKKVDDLVRELK